MNYWIIKQKRDALHSDMGSKAHLLNCYMKNKHNTLI